MSKENRILSFLKKQQLMVISTINNEGKPESAVVSYSEYPSLEIVFGTFNDTRKYKNLKKNQNVSLVIGWGEKEKITLQYEGVAEEIKDKKELILCKKNHISKNPGSESFVNHPKERIFKIKPKW